MTTSPTPFSRTAEGAAPQQTTPAWSRHTTHDH